MRVKKSKSESDIVKEILDGLKLYFRRSGMFWRQNNTGTFLGVAKGKRKYSFHGLKGVSDILGILKNGRFVAIEVKTLSAFKKKDNNLSEHQIEFLKNIEELNGIAICACRFEDVKNILNEKL